MAELHHSQQTPAPLASLPQTSRFTDSQWEVLSAIVDTVIPSILLSEEANIHDHQCLQPSDFASASTALARNDAVDQQTAVEYLAERTSLIPGSRDAFTRLVFHSIDAGQRRKLLFILSILNGRASILLTGHVTPFARLSVSERENVIRGWAIARLPMFQDLHRSLTTMANVVWATTSPSLCRILSFPKTPVNHNFGPGYSFSFLQIPPAANPRLLPKSEDGPEVIETDILIIGSGSAGAVAASVLSAQGLSIIVADKGYYWPPKFLPMTQESAMGHLFHNGGTTTADTGNINIAAGSCFGGGGTVNWSASLQLQGFVRQEWASRGLPYFTSGAFQADMDAVCERMGVGTTAVRHNYGNDRLLSGARKLGMNGKTVPQNTGGEAHECGQCTLGCGSCGKKGPTESWLPDAARNGARFIEGFSCERILFSSTPSETGDKVAIGAEGTWTSRDEHGGVAGERYTRPVRLLARRAVVVASGALGTPHLLQRSDIKNPHLGRHLRLHPISFLGAVYDEDVRPWEGAILTSVINDLENIDSSGHGVKMEATAMIPAIFLALFPWTSGLEWKLFCAKMRRMTGYISLARDQGEGRVYVDPDEKERLRVDYSVDKRDRKHIAMGLVALAKIQFIEGAREIHVSVPGVPAFLRRGDAQAQIDGQGINDPAFQDWLTHLERLVSEGMPSKTAFGCAHQMGSARMGSSPTTSVVDPDGRVWGTQGLYVVDTSVFPTASGVNPMITAMAIARGLSSRLARSVATAPTTKYARAKL